LAARREPPALSGGLCFLMLSYQHLWHAGNLADVHKHALLSVLLDYLVRKDKPLSYIETHAGRGLYDLSAPEALRTGEAAAGIGRVEGWFAADHPYARALAAVRAAHGPWAYPGSPLIARHFLRPGDRMHLAELHPQERAALEQAIGRRARVHSEDGFALALSMTPPDPRRGLMLVDPSYEVKADYGAIPGWLAKVHRRWNVGVLVLWYPLLDGAPHAPMLDDLAAPFPQAMRHEVRFPRLKPGKGLAGSGMFVVNPPWGLDAAAAELSARFDTLSRG
jgi:23S rRNA (adenine2030-N6)-methyltransferase